MLQLRRLLYHALLALGQGLLARPVFVRPVLQSALGLLCAQKTNHLRIFPCDIYECAAAQRLDTGRANSAHETSTFAERIAARE
jgi:hypothetical protein